MIEINIRRIGHARCAIAVHPSLIDLSENSLLQTVAERGHSLVIVALEALHCQLRSLAQGNYSGNVLGSRAARTFMPSAIKQRLNTAPPAHIKRPYSLRRMHLVTANRKRITANLLPINLNLPFCLPRIPL